MSAVSWGFFQWEDTNKFSLMHKDAVPPPVQVPERRFPSPRYTLLVAGTQRNLQFTLAPVWYCVSLLQVKSLETTLQAVREMQLWKGLSPFFLLSI